MTDVADPGPARDWPGAPVLQVDRLSAEFVTEAGIVRAVDDVSFAVEPGEVFAIVGESGCGKSTIALAILDLLPKPAGRIAGGRVLYRGEDLAAAAAERVRAIRGDRIAMIFQDPLTALNPTHRVGDQIAEVFRAHRDMTDKDAWERAIELLATVGIPRPLERGGDYPHQFSGGMRQRVMIAMAIALHPALLIADEPTTALDVTIQAQILELLLEVRERFEMAILLITHDLGVVAGAADHIMVMYAGKKVEQADATTLFISPKHPYTWGLLGSTTRIDHPRSGRMPQIPGAPPSLLHPPPACRFAPRCPRVQDICRRDYPDLRSIAEGHVAACHFAQDPGWAPSPAEVIP
jgi:peptide/nickel transport system ATP-binding protein/oligopeptide transport system ATP-binding protein